MISLIVLGLVFVLIAVRQVGKFRFRIWQVMLFGAFAVLVTGQISPAAAASAINLDVLLFLFGVFIVGRALQESGYLYQLSYRLFGRAATLDAMILIILFGMGIFSALLMNDTLAIIGTPVVLALARRSNTPPKIMLLALAFAVTIGSVMSPIGNPQNLLIAMHGGIANPFVTFFRFLLLPTLLNLLLAYLLLRLFFRRHFRHTPVAHDAAPLADAGLARLSRISLLVLVLMVAVKIIISFGGWQLDFRMTYMALAAALPVILFSRSRFGIIRRIDWSTLVFFAAMFVLMESVWNTGYFQGALDSLRLDVAAPDVIMEVSVLLSQLISNVPLVALYLPMLAEAGSTPAGLMALAAGGTIAGNLTILGAASNVIIIQNAEKESGATLTFWDFVKVGAPLTVLNVAVYWLFLSFMG